MQLIGLAIKGICQHTKKVIEKATLGGLGQPPDPWQASYDDTLPGFIDKVDFEFARGIRDNPHGIYERYCLTELKNFLGV